MRDWTCLPRFYAQKTPAAPKRRVLSLDLALPPLSVTPHSLLTITIVPAELCQIISTQFCHPVPKHRRR